jgi:hypothetical protein|tara:strand:+ start:171 stop:398 length:228 start_codon:yes stop_codon:yes gene_type:complete
MPKFDVMTTHMYSMHWKVDAVSKDSAAEKIYENMNWDVGQQKHTNSQGECFLKTAPDSEIRGVQEYEDDKVYKNQ